MNVKEKLESLLGRVLKIIPIKLNNKQGFIVEYFNYNDKNCASKLFSETKEGSLKNLLSFLQQKNPGGNNGISLKCK